MRATLVPAYERKDRAALVDHKLKKFEVKHDSEKQPNKNKMTVVTLGYINRCRVCLSRKLIIILRTDIVRPDSKFQHKFHITARGTLTTQGRFRDEGAGVKAIFKA